MQIKLFTIPIIGGEKEEAELNSFLRSRKVLTTKKKLVRHERQMFWCFCVAYVEGTAAAPDFKKSPKEKVDYKKLLSEADFEQFTKFRAIRKALAEKEAIPAYAVFTDAELAAIVQLGADVSLSDLLKVKGIGKQKAEKYGTHFIKKDETSR